MTNRPSRIEDELPILLWGKTVCIQMMGNDNWKHVRDYKAVLDLTRRWLLVNKTEELDKLYIKMEDSFLQDDQTIDWSLLEKVRVVAHDYLRELEDGTYNPDPEGYGMITMPDMWVIQRIRELTDS